jgi:hypothetical protein
LSQKECALGCDVNNEKPIRVRLIADFAVDWIGQKIGQQCAVINLKKGTIFSLKN